MEPYSSASTTKGASASAGPLRDLRTLKSLTTTEAVVRTRRKRLGTPRAAVETFDDRVYARCPAASRISAAITSGCEMSET
jgi:hypothetical protein